MSTIMGLSQIDVSAKKPAVPVVHDEGFFQHETGDTYEGFFEAKKKDRSVKMHGQGTYTTAEGDIYTGTWESGRFGTNEDVTIIFKDGAKYEGSFNEWNYTGPGKYTFPDGSLLQCNFVESCPTGELTFIDPNGHTWLGTAQQGYAWVEPVNHFYAMLERESFKTKYRKRSDQSAGYTE